MLLGVVPGAGPAAASARTAGSDIELLLVRADGADEGAWHAQTQRLAERASRWTGNGTRTLVLDEDEARPGEPVLADVLDHGLTVAGTHDWLARRLRPARVES